MEYRLWKGHDQYIPLYFYENIELEQILARRECEFFVKNGVTYKQLSSAIEQDLYVIYVEIFEENAPEILQEEKNKGISLEIRELNAMKNHPIVQIVSKENHLDILSMIGSSFLYVNHQEWQRDSAELDEDRLTYVLYGTPTGYEWEGEWK